MLLLGKLGKDPLGLAGDVLWTRVESVGLRDLHGAQLPRPRIQPAEDAAVKSLPMR